VYSGQTGALLWKFCPEEHKDSLGLSVSGAGDVNNDGYDDLIVGAPYAGVSDRGLAYVYSGQTGLPLRCLTGAQRYELGHSVSGAGDVDNDGFDDLIVGAPGSVLEDSTTGWAHVYSGLSGDLLFTFDGEWIGDWFGGSVSGAGDVNNDGYDDLIVGARYNDAGGADAGRAYVYSGQTGGPLWTFTGEATGDGFGWSVSGAGDVNNDGYDDLIVGARHNDAGGTDAGRAYVYSGQTGGLLWTFTGEAAGDRLGTSVSGAGDVNNDGYSDVIVGARNNDGGGSNAGRAYVYSGETGGLLWTFTGEASSNYFGHVVSGAGDVNNDGYDDLIVGSPSNDAGGADAGRAYVYSGRTGILLVTFTGEAAGDRLAWSVSGAGDVDDDGYDDLIVGAPQNDAGGSDAGRAYVYSGRYGSRMLTFTGAAAGDRLGQSVSGAGHVNADAHADLIVGAPYGAWNERTGLAYVHCVPTGDWLWAFAGEWDYDWFGVSVSGAGDVNNDGYADLLVGALWAGGDSAGRAYIHSGQTGALLWTFTGEAEGDEFGRSVSQAGDVNNDGYVDLIVGAPFNSAGGYLTGRAYVYSGQTLDLLWTFDGESSSDHSGWSVSGAGDVNNDGYDDVIVAAIGGDRAYVYSGQTGGLIWTLVGGGSIWGGGSVSGAGDVNNDGYADLIVGSPYTGGSERGEAYVYSGQTGELLWTFTGEAAGDRLGTSVSGAGDLNHDGYDDLMVGAPYNDAGGNDAGRAYVYCGQTGDLLWTFDGETVAPSFGFSVSEAGDVNQDGQADLVVGASGGTYVYSGQTGALLCTFYGQFGFSVSGAGDVNNDGYDEVIAGAPGVDVGWQRDVGAAYVFPCQVEESSLCGDVTADDVINVGDVVFLVSYLYKSGPPPVPECIGDVNHDAIVNIGDVVYVVSYLYKSGPAPDPDCCAPSLAAE
jgi:hypothetical protein